MVHASDLVGYTEYASVGPDDGEVPRVYIEFGCSDFSSGRSDCTWPVLWAESSDRLVLYVSASVFGLWPAGCELSDEVPGGAWVGMRVLEVSCTVLGMLCAPSDIDVCMTLNEAVIFDGDWSGEVAYSYKGRHCG